uniref:DOMON domain-containing protein n=1 Tax=Otus sunia TaxID=257818 RepID=A0A8C8AJR1_9STRI
VIKSTLFLLFLSRFCSGQPAPPLLRFSIFLDPSNMVYLRWDHDKQELMMFELQVLTTGWVAFGFSPHGELPGSDIVIGGVFPNDLCQRSCSKYIDLKHILGTCCFAVVYKGNH